MERTATTTGSRTTIEQLLFMLDAAFEGDAERPQQSWHALLVNLASAPREQWDWKPEGGSRTIASLALEVGVCKYVYDNRAFGDGSMDWNVPGSYPVPAGDSADDVVAYLRRGHAALRAHVAGLHDDAQLLEPRPGRWPDGRRFPLRWLINTTIQQDLYHAGEINHLPALCQGNDGGGD
ncbi:MAG: DinB family protein [Dehalococcoidia bacterium]|nr:DinB family protein [Dehalococcoidia bacterium]